MKTWSSTAIAALAFVVATPWVGSQEPTMQRVLADDAGATALAVTGAVFAPDHRLTIRDDTTGMRPVGDPCLAVLQRFDAYQAALEAGRLDDALLSYAPGEARERARTRFTTDAKQQIDQRKALRLEIIGCGVAGDLATVWYELIGPTVPGGRFPWLDQWRLVDGTWCLDPTVPMNHPSFCLLGVVLEGRLSGEPTVPIDLEAMAVFALRTDGAFGLLTRDGAERALVAASEPLIAMPRAVLSQRPRLIDEVQAEPGSGLRVLVDAHRAVIAGEATDRLFAVPAKGQPEAHPFGWGTASSMDYLYLTVVGKDQVFALIGPADEARRGVLISRGDGGFRVAIANTLGRRIATFNLLSAMDLIAKIRNAFEKSVE